MADYDRCNAPGIINTASGFHLVFCEGVPGHLKADHSLRFADRHSGATGVINWEYLGKPQESDDYAPPLSRSERCITWMHLLPLVKLLPSNSEPRRDQPLFGVVDKDLPSTGFCCGKEPGHDGEHVRSGIFGPLGIKWEIVW